MRHSFRFFYRSFIFFLLISCNGIAQQKVTIPSSDFEKKLNSGAYQVLDVRTAGEFKTGYLKNALQADWLNKEEFVERTKYLDKSKPVLVYCASGIRSEQAAKWMLKQGFIEVLNLKGGTSAWLVEGKRMEATAVVTQMKVTDFNKNIQSVQLVLVDVGAEWCPPCKKMEPLIKQLQTDLSGKFELVKVDGGVDIDVMKAIKASVLPTFIVYKNGKEIWRHEGIVTLETLKSNLQ